MMSIAEQLKLQDALERIALLEKRVGELERVKAERTLRLKGKPRG